MSKQDEFDAVMEQLMIDVEKYARMHGIWDVQQSVENIRRARRTDEQVTETPKRCSEFPDFTNQTRYRTF